MSSISILLCENVNADNRNSFQYRGTEEMLRLKPGLARDNSLIDAGQALARTPDNQFGQPFRQVETPGQTVRPYHFDF